MQPETRELRTNDTLQNIESLKERFHLFVCFERISFRRLGRLNDASKIT